MTIRTLIRIAVAFAIIGAGLVGYAFTLPVYTQPDAPEKLSAALESRPANKNRFKEWYAQLHTFETPHKRCSDVGRGLLAAGLGLLVSAALLSYYQRHSSVRNLWFIVIIWLLLWGIKIPLTFWYYGIRQARFDYPVWGDSIAIPIFTDCMMWGIGAVISSLFLFLLSIKRRWPDHFQWIRPHSFWGWLRLMILAAWSGLIFSCIILAIPEGDEGMIFPCIIAQVMLLLLVCAPENPGKIATLSER